MGWIDIDWDVKEPNGCVTVTGSRHNGLQSEMSGFGEGSLARMRDQDAAMDVDALGCHERFPGKQWDGLALFGMSQSPVDV